jgi:hypothetical protein
VARGVVADDGGAAFVHAFACTFIRPRTGVTVLSWKKAETENGFFVTRE